MADSYFANFSIGQKVAISAKDATIDINASHAKVITQQKYAMERNSAAIGEKEMTGEDTQRQRDSNQKKKGKGNKVKMGEMTLALRIMRKLVEIEEPKCQSALNTIMAILLPTYPFTIQEQLILRNLDKSIFRIVMPIKVDMLEKLTINHPNRPYMEYLIDGLRHGFRYSFQGQ